MVEREKEAEKSKSEIGVLGGLFFLAFGLVTLGYIISVDYVGAFQASRVSLQQTPATLNSIEVRESSSRTGTTFNLKADFTYRVDGVEYTGTRLGFGETQWDGSRRFQESRKHEVLSREPFFVFVDTRTPSRAMLFDKRDGIITGATIILTCLGVFFTAIGGFNLIRCARNAKATHTQ